MNGTRNIPKEVKAAEVAAARALRQVENQHRGKKMNASQYATHKKDRVE